jgi:RNA polymerase sigma-70 factor
VDDSASDSDRERDLARACAAGDADALATFERDYLARVPVAVAHLRLAGTELDEVAQHVRAKLLVERDDAGVARIVGYADGRLHGLVKVIAVRAALDLVRHKKRDAPGEGPLAFLPSKENDPELAFLKATYRAAFAECFAKAAATLEPRQRNWLRLHVLENVGLEEIARLYGTSRATVVRQLAEARAHLLRATRKALGQQLGVDVRELDSIMGLIESRLDASVARDCSRRLAVRPEPSRVRVVLDRPDVRDVPRAVLPLELDGVAEVAALVGLHDARARRSCGVVDREDLDQAAREVRHRDVLLHGIGDLVLGSHRPARERGRRRSDGEQQRERERTDRLVHGAFLSGSARNAAAQRSAHSFFGRSLAEGACATTSARRATSAADADVCSTRCSARPRKRR